MVRILSTIPAWGWETKNCYSKLGKKSGINAWKVLAYFPFTGTLIACIKGLRVLDLCKNGKINETGNTESFQFLVIRAAIEFTGMAFLTLPLIDLCVTVCRNCQTTKNDSDLGKPVESDGETNSESLKENKVNIPRLEFNEEKKSDLSQILSDGARSEDSDSEFEVFT